LEYTKEIFAQYNSKTIRVYQAYNFEIASQAVRLQNFGTNFNTQRMTWIKPSFLWMMYRSNWGTKKNQECILALDIDRNFFDSLLERAVLTSPDSTIFTGIEWEKNFRNTNVYCQWDPDRNINGDSINRSAIQIGIKEQAVTDFLSGAIKNIEDITPLVRKWNLKRKSGKLTLKDLPTEKIYPIIDKNIRKRLNMKQEKL